MSGMLRKNGLFVMVLLLIVALFVSGGCGGGSSSGDGGPPTLSGTPAEFEDIAGYWNLLKLDAKAAVTVDISVVDSLPDDITPGKDVIKAFSGEYTASFVNDPESDDPGDLTLRIPDGLWNKVKDDEEFTDLFGSQNPGVFKGNAYLYVELDENDEGADTRSVAVELTLVDEDGAEDGMDSLAVPLKRKAPGEFEIDEQGDGEDLGLIEGLTYSIKADLTIKKETVQWAWGEDVFDLPVLNILVNGTFIIYYDGEEIGRADLNDIVLRAEGPRGA
jgi:hypothetical protein